MGGYDDYQIMTVTLPLFDFGGGAAETMSFRIPDEYDAELIKIGVMITEVFATDLTTGSVQLGTAADADAYAKLVIPDGTADNDCYDETDDTDAIISANISANSLVRVTLTNGTDGTAVTGQGIPLFVFRMRPAL
jgi:hypothetical protein